MDILKGQLVEHRKIWGETNSDEGGLCPRNDLDILPSMGNKKDVISPANTIRSV